MKSSSGITLIEVLVILAVLVLLFALLFPIEGCGDNARRASAKNDTVQIAAAITSFQTEYGHLPSTNGEVQDVCEPILGALTGANTNLNPRQIVFLEVQAAKKGKGGVRDGVFVDPWGSPYKMKLDIDDDKWINNAGPSATVKIMKTVAIWTDPSTHQDKPSEAEKKRRAATSWD